MSDLKTLRYGSLREVQDLLEARPPASMSEARAALMNLIDHQQMMDRELTRFAERLEEIRATRN